MVHDTSVLEQPPLGLSEPPYYGVRNDKRGAGYELSGTPDPLSSS